MYDPRSYESATQVVVRIIHTLIDLIEKGMNRALKIGVIPQFKYANFMYSHHISRYPSIIYVVSHQPTYFIFAHSRQLPGVLFIGIWLVISI